MIRHLKLVDFLRMCVTKKFSRIQIFIRTNIMILLFSLCRRLMPIPSGPIEINNHPTDLATEWLQENDGSESNEWDMNEIGVEQFGEQEQGREELIPKPGVSHPRMRRRSSHSSASPSCMSGMTSLSSVGRQELLRLAQAAEEADAPVLQLNESHTTDWSFLKSAVEKSFLEKSQNPVRPQICRRSTYSGNLVN